MKIEILEVAMVIIVIAAAYFFWFKRHISPGVHFFRLARERGVSVRDFVSFTENRKRLNNLFAEMDTTDAIWVQNLEENAKKIGAQVRVISIDVDYGCDVSVGNRPYPFKPRFSDAQRMEFFKRYQWQEKKIVRETIVFVSWKMINGLRPKCGYEASEEFRKENGLKQTLPQVLLAIGQHDFINGMLEEGHVQVSETTGFKRWPDIFCCNYWDEGKGWRTDFAFDSDLTVISNWFAYLR